MDDNNVGDRYRKVIDKKNRTNIYIYIYILVLNDLFPRIVNIKREAMYGAY